MKIFKIFLIFGISFLFACVDQTNNKPSPDTSSQTPKEPALTVKDFAYAVPLRDISTVNLWKLPGAKNMPNNEVLETLSASTRVGIIERKPFGYNDSAYFHVELEDGTRGFIGRPFISRDALGNAFYEKNPKTGEILRNGSGYSYSQDNNCILHVAALTMGDLSKGEFETTAEFEKRKQDAASTISWFNSDITYTYIYSFSGTYDADKQIFDYTDYSLPDEEKQTKYSSNSSQSVEIPYIEFDNDCTSEFGYRMVEYEKDYRTAYGKADTLLKIMGAKLPANFIDPKYSYSRNFGATKRIGRKDAPNYKYVQLYFGVKPTVVQSAQRGSNYGGYSGPRDHVTKLSGDVSYIFLITKDGKNVVESYVSSDYKNSWQQDLQSQLTIAGYDVGLIDGFAGDATKKAIEAAAKDGILPNAEVSIRTTMLLIDHNQKKNK